MVENPKPSLSISTTMEKENKPATGGAQAPKVERTQLLTTKLKAIFHQLSGISEEEMDDRATFLELVLIPSF